MSVPAARGFTLVELLLAVALAATVAASAFAALELFVEADARAIDATEQAIDVDRALGALRRDVTTATTLDLRSDQLQLAYADGSAVVWVLPSGDTELHRLAGASLLSLAVPVQTLVLAAAGTPSYDARGHLHDSAYRASAVIQGAIAITWDAVRAQLDNREIGVALHVTHRGPAGDVVSSCAAVSLALAEAHARR